MQQEPVTAPAPANSNERTNKLKLIWGLIFLLAPSALFVLALILAAVSNLVFGTSNPSARVLVNVIVFLMGALVVLTWLPGIIAGIILLATRKK